MRGKDQGKRPGKPQARRPQPAAGGIIDSRPVEAGTGAEAPAAVPEPITSTLVGTGGTHAAMPPRAGAGATAALPAEPAAKPEPAATSAPTAKPATKPGPGSAPSTAAAAKTTPAEPAARPKPEPATAAAPPSAGTTPRPAPEPAPPPRRGGFWPLAAGGVVAAALGAGATWYVLDRQQVPALDVEALKQQILADIPAPTIDPDQLAQAAAAAIADAGDRIEASAEAAAEEAVTRRLAEAEGADSAPELAAALQAQAERLDAVEAALADLAAQPASPGAADAGPAAAASTAQPGEAAPPQADALDALRGDLADLRAEFAALTAGDGSASDDLAALRERVDALDARPEPSPAATPEELAALADRVAALEGQLGGFAAAIRARDALRAGDAEAMAAAAQALEAAGLEAAPLAAAPTLAQLQDGYDAAARAALTATRAAAPQGGTLSGIGAFLADKTRARSVAPRAGDDPDAIQSRAGAAVEAGDIAGALDELAAMPEAGRAAMAGWLTQAEAWVAAQDALGQITQPAASSQ